MRFKLNHIFQLLDCVLILIACSIAYYIRYDSFFLPNEYIVPTLVIVLFGSLSLAAAQHYSRIHDEFEGRVKTAFTGLLLTAMSTSMFLYLTKTGQDFSRIWLGLSIVIALLLVLTVQQVLSRIIHVGNGKKRIVLLGGNRSAHEISKKLTDQNSTWLVVDKQFDLTEPSLHRAVSYIENMRGKNSDMVISEVWITQDVYTKIEYSQLLSAFSNSSVKLVLVPELPPELHGEIPSIDFIEGFATINSGLSDLNRINGLLKFLEDKIIAGCMLLILSPLFLLIAIAILFSSAGPIFYRQARFGTNGKQFKIWKFRTMTHDSKSATFVQATKNDARVTKIGKFLRRLSLDEIPQLFNVLGGDMSLVGPRPHPNNLNEQYRSKIDDYMKRHTVKPGLTGLAQINGFRGETHSSEAMERRIDFDLQYIQEWSILLDFKILLLTVFHVVSTDKAY